MAYLQYFAIFSGRIGYWRWNPVRIVLEYDAGDNTHRFVTQEEGEELLDADSYKMVWGEKKRVYRIRTLLNRLNRAGLRDVDIAEKMGVSKPTISKWRSGSTTPAADRQRELEAMASSFGQGNSKVTQGNSGEKTRDALFKTDDGPKQLSGNFRVTDSEAPNSGEPKNARRPIQNSQAESNRGGAYNYNVNNSQGTHVPMTCAPETDDETKSSKACLPKGEHLRRCQWLYA